MLLLSTVDRPAVTRLLLRFHLNLRVITDGTQIPGSYWGESEAGLRGQTLFARLDTPLHSLLHEGAHYICMTPERRVGLDRDAGGDDAEESAVCYLQVVLADHLGISRERICADMDAWGYSFRLRSALRWFDEDAQDSRRWLQQRGILDVEGRLTWALRWAS
jgi:hypothetical protein